MKTMRGSKLLCPLMSGVCGIIPSNARHYLTKYLLYINNIRLYGIILDAESKHIVNSHTLVPPLGRPGDQSHLQYLVDKLIAHLSQ